MALGPLRYSVVFFKSYIIPQSVLSKKLMFYFVFKAMLSLIAPLLFIGLSSPAYSQENKESRGRFITLRDYDFVGEDATLRAELARRMAVLQAPDNLTAPEPRAAPAPAPRRQWHLPVQDRPDYLNSSLKLPQMVNVSLDYGELLNASDWNLAENASSLAFGPGTGPIPGSGAAFVPGPGATLVPGPYAAPALKHGADLVPSSYAALGPGLAEGPGPRPGANPVPGSSLRFGPVDGRRQSFDLHQKILDLMKHYIYSTQRKITELDHVIKKYQSDPRFRMAYIYNRLDEWKHNLRTVYYAMKRPRYYHLRNKRLIWYYEHSLRINIDITYSIEHLVHLHSEYMKLMEKILPLSKRQEIKEMKRQERKVRKMKEMGFPAGAIV